MVFGFVSYRNLATRQSHLRLACGDADSACLHGSGYMHHTPTTCHTHPLTHTTPLHPTKLYSSSVRGVPVFPKRNEVDVYSRFICACLRACVGGWVRFCMWAHQCVRACVHMRPGLSDLCPSIICFSHTTLLQPIIESFSKLGRNIRITRTNQLLRVRSTTLALYKS